MIACSRKSDTNDDPCDRLTRYTLEILPHRLTNPGCCQIWRTFTATNHHPVSALDGVDGKSRRYVHIMGSVLYCCHSHTYISWSSAIKFGHTAPASNNPPSLALGEHKSLRISTKIFDATQFCINSRGNRVFDPSVHYIVHTTDVVKALLCQGTTLCKAHFFFAHTCGPV